jgi:hypothetical protein
MGKIKMLFWDENVVIQRIKNVKIKGCLGFYSKKNRKLSINCINRQIDLVEAPDWTGITSFISPENVR